MSGETMPRPTLPLGLTSGTRRRLYRNNRGSWTRAPLDATRHSSETIKGPPPDAQSDVDLAIASKKAQNRYAWIPAELLVIIFHIDLDKHKPAVQPGPRAPSRISRTVSLSSVCSHWRSAIIGTSSLWSHIPLHLSESFVGLCLERSQNSLLDVVAIHPFNSDKLSQGAHLLRGHTEKIRSLNLDAHTSEQIRWAADWVSGLKPLCRLQELSVMFTQESWRNQHSYLYPSFELESLANQLHTLSLKSIKLNRMAYTFNWLCVLKLTGIHGMETSVFEHIIATSPMLRILELAEISLPRKRSSPDPIPLPNLKNLHICYTPWPTLGSIFSVLGLATCDVELGLDKGSFQDSLTGLGLLHVYRNTSGLKNAIGNHNIKKINILTIGHAAQLIKEHRLSFIMFTLPKVTTLRLDDMVLDTTRLSHAVYTANKFPQITTIQMRRCTLPEEGFIDIFQSWTIAHIELVDCWAMKDIQEGPKYQIERGTRLYDWALESAPHVSFPQE